MILSAHVAAGVLAGMVSTAATARRVVRVGLALALGFLSHVVLDSIPHSDYVPLSSQAKLWVALGELVAMIGILTIVLNGRLRTGWRAPVVLGVLAAGIADAKFVAPVLGSSALTASVTSYGNWLHDHFHASPPSSPLIGLGFEVAATLLMTGTLLLFPRAK